MDSGNIKRVQPEAALPAAAVRRAAARRQRGGSEQEFADELEREGEPPVDEDVSASASREDLPVAPPEEDEAGGQIDLVG